MQRRKILGGAILATLVATVALAAATGDRLKTPVQVGQGQAVLEKIVFDQGAGAANPLMQSTAGGSLQLSTNGTNLLTVPAITDTIAGLTASQTLTNKTLTSPAINGGSIAGASVGTSTWTSGTFAGTIAGTPTFSGNVTFSGNPLFSGTIQGSPNLANEITGSNGSAATPTFGFSAENSGMYRPGAGQLGFAVSSTAVASLTTATLSVPTLTQTTTGGNTPHNCGFQTATNGASATFFVTVTCSGSKTLMGGGCSVISGSPQLNSSWPSTGTTWRCDYTTSVANVTAYAMCCDF